MWSESLWGLRRLYWQPTLKRAIEQWRPTAQQKRLYLHHQGEFQHQNCTVGTVHDSDHEGVVRIFVRHSYHSNELFTLITRHNFSYTRSVIGGSSKTTIKNAFYPQVSNLMDDYPDPLLLQMNLFRYPHQLAVCTGGSLGTRLLHMHIPVHVLLGSLNVPGTLTGDIPLQVLSWRQD